jgi:3-dehydroquinate dehydratase / shikimate dehydrogenase
MREEKQRARICVPVCAESARALPEAIARAAGLADVVELRLDCLSAKEFDRLLDGFGALLETHTSPFILTLRPAEQGGRREIDSLNRLVFWLDYLSRGGPGTELADIELELVRLLMEKEGVEWNRIICSRHDFTGAPANLENLYQEMAVTPARLLKIAVSASDSVDCLPVFKILERARSEGRSLIALAMGRAGVMTRILGPSRGAYLTYGALDCESATAPGQVTAAELRGLYRVDRITEETAVLGLVGSPVSHSISPQIHNRAFAETETDAVYIPFEVRDVEAFFRRMVSPRTREMSWNLRGLSVTAPHKRAVMEYLDRLDDAAAEIGAVNTIIVEGTELHGYNTDAAGFLAPLKKRVGELKGKEAAVIGAGGAARAALWSLKREGAQVTLFARNMEKAAPLAEAFGARLMHLDGSPFSQFDVVINATPLGMRGAREGETPALASQLSGVRLAYDLVYNPRVTRFLREAEAAGCETLYGLEMMVAQAAAQFRLWTGKEAPVQLMSETARGALADAQ